MSGSLDGKVVLVAGASGGLGEGVVAAALDAGATVVAAARAAGRLRVEGRLHFLPADLADEAEAERAVTETVARHRRLDALFNLVGGYEAGAPVAELGSATWHKMMRLNLDVAFYLCRAAVRPMLAARAGRIVNVGARAAVEPSPRAAAYAVSKSALVAFSRTLAEEVRQEGVTVNVVLPSIIDTPANRAAMPGADASKWVAPDALGRLLVLLAGDDAAIVSGAVIPAYGRA